MFLFSSAFCFCRWRFYVFISFLVFCLPNHEIVIYSLRLDHQYVLSSVEAAQPEPCQSVATNHVCNVKTVPIYGDEFT